ncbi:hypothetical protein TNCV_1136921 [Trichonephila clavipes]|nr:hypothetical protein TNCV_1136921 [Trichonephila clavipes]
MEMNTDYHMPSDSRSPSRPATPVPTATCQRHQQLADEIQKFTLLIQGQLHSKIDHNLRKVQHGRPCRCLPPDPAA